MKTKPALSKALALGLLVVCICAPAMAAEPFFKLDQRAEPQHGLLWTTLVVQADDDPAEELLSNCADWDWCIYKYDPAIRSMYVMRSGHEMREEARYSDAWQPTTAGLRALVGSGTPTKFLVEYAWSDGNSRLAQFDLRTGELDGTVASEFLSTGAPFYTDGDNDGSPEIVLFGGETYFLTEPPFRLKDPAPVRIPNWDYDYGAVAGDVDGDGKIEFVVEQGKVYEIVGREVYLDWTFGVFGPGDVELVLGDLSGDGVPDILVQDDQQLTVFNAVTKSSLWSRSFPFDPHAVSISDLDGDGVSEVIVGQMRDLVNNISGSVQVLDGPTGSTRWAVDYPDGYVKNSLTADLDGDGRKELVFSGWNPYTGPDRLFVVDTELHEIVNAPAHQIGPYRALAITEPDADGKRSIYTGPRYELGTGDVGVEVRSLGDLRVQSSSPHPLLPASTDSGLAGLARADIDGDGIPEVIVGSSTPFLGAQAYVYRESDWTLLRTYDSGRGRTLAQIAVQDLDGDGRKEMVFGESTIDTDSSGAFLQVFDSETAELKSWARFGRFTFTWVYGLSIANIDADPQLEIVATFSPNTSHTGDPRQGEPLAVIDGSTLELSSETTHRYLGLNLRDVDGDGVSEIIAGTDAGKVVVMDGSLAIHEEFDVCNRPVFALSRDLDTFDSPSVVYFTCADKLGWVDVASGVSGFLSHEIGTDLGLWNHLYRYRTPAGKTRVLASTAGALVDLAPVSNLRPQLLPNSLTSHWAGRPALTFQVPFVDPDGDTLVPTIDFQADLGTAWLDGPPLIHQAHYEPGTGTGLFTVGFSVSDGEQTSAPATTIVRLTNRPPELAANPPPGQLGGIFAVDPDDDPLTITLITPPQKGSLSFHYGTFHYTPRAGETGPDTFNATVSDGLATVGPATITLVIPTPEPPAETGGGGGGGIGTLLLSVLSLAWARRRFVKKSPWPATSLLHKRQGPGIR